MIGGIGALQFKPAIDGAEAASPGLLQGGVGTQASESVGGSFAEALSQAATKTVNTLQNAEQMSIQALKGDADTRQVVDAVMSAQQALQTTIAIRDKVVSAYLEISRMNI
ncbi:MULTISPECIES: flagellar hook-basal body complex protein FliE [unclassified Mesorhizobium]|uniref:flagellar hook-basal body complex protein FliE n=1 Tax=unclassified Mesorhizobium TaxID=325217 RepID=UPI000FCA0F34|nr:MULTISPECIES: flagellar hook-basal body complex protein FliE [unclassified Mesorhizobium]TIT78630.1 MAG: flagellar hook-basal body complex protein FliE [Mesorhizobium sp.]TGP23815.1 flagellar hook-basal body complex protein FliE [Mesorhizobium sp. M1D.F.Ca.ET.231.01.1.1]TGP33959.1 flagellar hook-basal body complex protein FliE [Mesorhizobium sp. M1D.F.Ca.ET.234.01.1.1]TGS47324.1 flagellar hook-basal body complex protein FliE [Mesorhizobium sp. M1D.F.Ca.ET.184.01.1.1]TGS62584.1 flagellar hoo